MTKKLNKLNFDFKKGQKLFARLTTGNSIDGTIVEKDGKLFLLVRKKENNIFFSQDSYYYLSAIKDVNKA